MEWVELKLKNYRTKEPLCRRGRFGESHGAMGVAAVVVEPCREMGRGPRREREAQNLSKHEILQSIPLIRSTDWI